MPLWDEETPLLGSSQSQPYGSQDVQQYAEDIHRQFCLLAGVPPSNQPPGAPRPTYARRSLYGRAIHKRNAQSRIYLFTASLSNTLLLSQVVLGATLTGLGAWRSSHVLVTIFGALNTIIAGIVAYLKSRGQPMRARMFRDDLERVVDEIENSEVMWLGIQTHAHGYDEIAIDDSVSVRSEVARLTRLYDKVVKNNTMNNPDMYMNALGDGSNAALRARPIPQPPAPATGIEAPGSAPAAADEIPSAQTGVAAPAAAAPNDPDTAPASAPPKSKTPPPAEGAAAPDPAPGTAPKTSKTPSSTPSPES